MSVFLSISAAAQEIAFVDDFEASTIPDPVLWDAVTFGLGQSGKTLSGNRSLAFPAHDSSKGGDDVNEDEIICTNLSFHLLPSVPPLGSLPRTLRFELDLSGLTLPNDTRFYVASLLDGGLDGALLAAIQIGGSLGGVEVRLIGQGLTGLTVGPWHSLESSQIASQVLEVELSWSPSASSEIGDGQASFEVRALPSNRVEATGSLTQLIEPSIGAEYVRLGIAKTTGRSPATGELVVDDVTILLDD